MEYKAIEKVIEEEISEVYLIDGVEYKADIRTWGPYGVYGNMAYNNRQAVVELEGLGRVRVIFPKDRMLVPSDCSPARFTPYAEEMIDKAVREYVGFTKNLNGTRLVNQVMEFEVI
ncbi:MAG: hypothetical protein WCY78_07980 [Sphaerochaetaceae bacterium]